MSEANTNQTTIITIVAIVCTCAVLVAPVACTINQQNKISEAINKGLDPIAVRCAMEGTKGAEHNASVCVIKAIGK